MSPQIEGKLFILRLNVKKVTDLRFLLPLSLFACLLLICFFIIIFLVLLPTLSLVSSVTKQLSETSSAFPFSHSWLRGIFVTNRCIFQKFTSWRLSLSLFLACRSERPRACSTKQTDSEQTDFAFDGEMTATEVCTSMNAAGFVA